MSLYDAHRCLCRAAVGYQSHSHTLLSSSSNKHRVSSEKLQPRYFLWCWLAFTARSPRTASTKSHFCRWQLFSLCDPQEVFSPWISPWISLLACLCRAGTDMDVHASCQNVRTNGLRQAICYISPAKNKINNIYIYFLKINDLFPINLWQQHRNLKHSIRRTQAHWSRQQQQHRWQTSQMS